MRRVRFCAGVGLAVILAGCGSPEMKSGTAQPDPVPVRLERPGRIDRAAVVAASGAVEARETVETGFQVAGRIRKMYAQEGDFVRAGQLLADLDPTDYQFGAAGAAAQTDAARANVRKAEAGARRQEVEQARVDYERWADEYRRMKMLFDRQSLAPADFKKIEAGYLAAKESYDMAREGAREEDKQAAAALLRQAEAQRGYEQKRVADTRLTAPIGGVIARRLADPGKITAAGHPVFVILDLQRAKVRVGVPEAEIGKLRTGQTAAVLIPSLDNRAFPGVVEMVGFAADPVSRTFSVKIDVPNPRLELRAGMVAESRIETGVRVRAITVPAEAIVRDPQGATQVYVYFAEHRRAHLRRVETGTLIEKAIEITKGLQGAEQVVVAGQQFLTDGAPVRVESPR